MESKMSETGFGSGRRALALFFMLAVFLLSGHAPFAAEKPDVAGTSQNASSPPEGEKPRGGEPEKAESKEGEEMGSQQARNSPDAGSNAPEQATYPNVINRAIISDEPGKPTIYFYYPELGNEKVDAALKEFAETTVENFKKHCEEAEDAGNLDLAGTYAISRPNPDVVSVTFNVYAYEGGAHGNLIITCLNYDLRGAERLGIADIFGNPEKAIEIMSAQAIEKLMKDLGPEADEDMIREGAAPEAKNFGNVALNPDGVVIEFQPYQVGPWSIGPQEVHLPLSELSAAKPSPLIWPQAAGEEVGKTIGH